MKTQNISKYALWLCVGIAIVVLGLFFFVGFDNENEAKLKDPENTNLLIYAMYGFTIVLTVLTLVNLVLAVFKFRDGGLMRILISIVSSLGLFAIFRYIICSGQEVAANDPLLKLYDDGKLTIQEQMQQLANDMAMADAFIWAVGILLVLAIAAWLVCASGILGRKK